MPTSFFSKIKDLKFKIHILFISVLMAFSLGIISGRTVRFPKKLTETSNNKYTQVEITETDKLKSSLSMCLDDQAETTQLDSKIYNYNDVGIYSPLLEGLSSDRTLYTYKRNEIEAIHYSLKRDQEFPIDLTIFTLNKVIKLPQLEGNIVIENNLNKVSGGYDFPIFYAYEFADFVRPESYISAWLPKDPLAQDVYISKNNIRMYWGLSAGPKCVYAVTLRFYASTLRGKQVFIIMSKARQDEFNPCQPKEDTQEINLLRRDLEKVADTFELSKSD